MVSKGIPVPKKKLWMCEPGATHVSAIRAHLQLGLPLSLFHINASTIGGDMNCWKVFFRLFALVMRSYSNL